MPQITACRRLQPGPASATQIMSRFGLRSAPKFTGTGFAQPKMKPTPPAAAEPASMMSGRMIVPKGSMCFAGFSVTRPIIHAVLSPNFRAA